MAPASSKRKRPDRQASEDDTGSRPSPYKPERTRNSLTRRASQQMALAEKETADTNKLLQAEAPTPRNGIQTSAPAIDSSKEIAMDSNVAGNAVADQARPLYRYLHITDAALASGPGSTGQDVIAAAIKLDELQLSDVFSELVRSALEGRITGPEAGFIVREIFAARMDGDLDLEYLFINTLEILYDASYKADCLRELVAATGLDQQRLREELDVPILMDLGLVRTTFDRIRTRKTTNALYRQANFNLLREESEGYAKLITEFFNTAQEASSRREEDLFMAEDAFQRVKALVGAFDLDVGRVLDIILDVSANLLVKAYPFFIKFLRASSWWPLTDRNDNIKSAFQGIPSLLEWTKPGSGRWGPNDEEREASGSLKEAWDTQFWLLVRDTGIAAFFELGSRRIVDFESAQALLESEVPQETDARGKEVNPDKRARLIEDRKYMRETRCLTPSGNHDAAQLLGFKLRFYASSARDASDFLQDNLVFLTALLIKIGFISLRDLYPHLYPEDEDMSGERTRLEKEKAEKEAKDRPGAGMNALLSAGALSDDTLPPPKSVQKDKSGGATPAQDKKDEPKEELPTPVNQKILLLKALLLIGALPEALFILGRFPWLAEVDISLPPLLHRIVRHMLSKMTELVLPMRGRPGLQDPQEQLFDTTARPDGTLLLTSRAPKKTTRWLHNDVFDKIDGLEYRHYYTDWNDNIPVCQKLEDVFLLCNTFLGYLGPKIGQDVVLYGTLLRLAQNSLTEDTSDNNRSRWLELMKRLLVPALSCSDHNPQLSQQVHDLLSLFPTATRYNIYAEWFLGKTSRSPDVRAAFAKNKYETRDVLRRVSNELAKRQSRALGKVALSSPGIVMMEMISQLESYSNMIPSLVECCRYFSPLAWDILNWALINSLSGMGRDRMQADGMLTSPWLRALSQFVATLFTKYAHLNLTPILQYLASELRVGNSTDLELLEQVLAEMAGIRVDVEFNDNQVVAMAGGQALQTHILSQLSDTRHLKQKEASRLMKSLAGPGLTGQILIAIAQELQIYPHHESSRFMPLKVLGNNLDKIRAVFMQYLDVLRTNLDAAKFESTLPPVVNLVSEFGIPPGIALSIHRSAIRGRIVAHDASREKEQEDKKATTTDARSNSDVTMKDSGPTGDEQVNAEPAKLDAGDNDPAHAAQASEDLASASESTSTWRWHPILEPLMLQLKEVDPDLSSRVSPPFFVTFWTLDLFDVLMPMDSYKRETKKLEEQIKEITSDRSDVTALAARDRDKKKRGLLDTMTKIRQEPTTHLKAYIAVRNRINGPKGGKGDKDHFFPSSQRRELSELKAEIEAKHLGLLQECFLPRAMMSAIDAHFTFQVVKMLHDNNTPGFSLMHLLHQLFKKQALAALIFQCTANEAQHFGRFLCDLLRHLQTWHADKGTYEKEALGVKNPLHGFVKTYDENGNPKAVMDYENFRRMLFNCHAFLSGALQMCFESEEYMHIRNGIIVLKAVVPVFPAVKFMAVNIVERITKISKDDSRSDIKLAAMSLLGPLKGREKQWVLPQAFRLNDPAKDGGKAGSRPPSARPETPRPGAGTPKLNAVAPDFKPTSASAVNGAGRKESVLGGPEDGEIEDERRRSRDTEMKDAPAIKSQASLPAERGPDADGNLRGYHSMPVVNTPPADPNSSSRPPTASTMPSRSATSRQSSRASADMPMRTESNVALKPPPTASAIRDRDRHNRANETYGRLDRPNDVRPGSREHSPGRPGRGRTPPEGALRGYRDERQYERGPDRALQDRGVRDEIFVHPSRREPPQAQNSSLSDVHDRPQPVGRVSEGPMHPDRMNRVEAGPAQDTQHALRPTSSGTSLGQPTAEPAVNPERMRLINADSSSLHGGRESRFEDKARRERDGRLDDRGFGARPDVRRGAAEFPRDVQLPRMGQHNDLAPTGPKSGRGRLSEMGPPQSESTYGRLNGPQDLTPLGPRQQHGPAGRGGRNFTAPVSTRGLEPASLPTTTRPPDPPAAFRGPQRSSSGLGPQEERSTGNNSAPGTPVHENGSGPPVHPSRAAQFQQQQQQQTQQAPPIQTNLPSITGPPSGPRGNGRRGPPVGTPTGPSPVNSIPPSGPASGRDSQRGARHLSDINATLKSTNGPSAPGGQGVQVRGASSRQSSVSYPTSGPRTVVPTAVSSMDPPQMRSPMGAPPSTRVDLFQGKPDSSDDGRHRDEERSGRGRGSRDHSREPRHDGRDQQYGQYSLGPADGRDKRGPHEERRPRDERPPRDGSSRRDGPRAVPPLDRQGPERQPRGPPPDMAGSFGPANPAPPISSGPPLQNDYPRGGPRRDGFGRGAGPGRHEDFTRGGPPRDERRDGGRPPREDGQEGRKRRHEDSLGGFDPTKRRRSGK